MSDRLTTAWVAREMAARGYDVIPGPDLPITGGAADSRKVSRGDLFTAFPGENVDGNRFVASALQNGAVVAICERAPSSLPEWATVVVAPDATRAVGELASAWRAQCNPKVVGITGTVGKTTTREITAAVLASRFRTHSSTGNFNSREGLPLALMSLTAEHEVSVLEMGMDRPGEIVELCEIARPDIGVVLNIGLTHVSKLGSIEAIAAEKLSLARWLPAGGTAVLNAEDPRIAAAIPGLRCQVGTFGPAGMQPELSLSYSEVEDRGERGTRFAAAIADRRVNVESPLPGTHTLASVAAAMVVGMVLGMSLAETAAAVRKSGATGRTRTIRGKNGATIIDDRYNSSPASLEGALRALSLRGPGRRIAFIGKMAELGEHEVEEHRRLGRIAAECADVVVTFGETCRPLAEAAEMKARMFGSSPAIVEWFATREEAASVIAARVREGDTVLVKGSRSEALEDILPLLEAQA